jgi:hypothetical protein
MRQSPEQSPTASRRHNFWLLLAERTLRRSETLWAPALHPVQTAVPTLQSSRSIFLSPPKYFVRACGCCICKANWLISCYTHKSSWQAPTRLLQDLCFMHLEFVREYKYFNNAVCHEYSPLGRISSTSTTPCAVTTHLPVARVLHQLRRAPRLLVVRPVTPSRGTTTRRPDCTGSTAPMSCIQTRRPAARLLVGR